MLETAKAVSSINIIETVNSYIRNTESSRTLQQLASNLKAKSAAAAAAIVAIAAASEIQSILSDSRSFNVTSATNAKTTTITINNNINKHEPQQHERQSENYYQGVQNDLNKTKKSAETFSSRISPFQRKLGNLVSEIDYPKTGTAEELISSALSNEKILYEYNNFVNLSPALTSTIINESDFPQLGVRWSPSFSTAGGGGGGVSTGINSPVNIGGANFGNNGNAGNGTTMSSSTTTSPAHALGGSITSMTNVHQHHQTSIQNAMFMRDPMMQMNRPYEDLFGKTAANGMYAKVTGGKSNLNANLIRSNISLNPSANEFRMQNEDFPALPASHINVHQSKSDVMSSVSGAGSVGVTHMGAESGDASGGAQAFTTSDATLTGGDAQHHQQQQQQQAQQMGQASSSTPKTGIQTHPDGLVTNIPYNMLNDQYGMAGLLTFLRTIESDPAIIVLALGLDLTNLGLNLNSSKKNLHETFGGPWSDTPCRIQDLEAKVPDEYLTNASIREQLPHVKLNKLSEDVLFFLFYNCPGEVYQVAAASELYQRDWRYHKADRVWLTRSPYTNHPMENTGSYEKSTYHIFDPVQWRKISKDMVLEYKQLENRPSPASAIGVTQNAASITNTQMPPPPPNMMAPGMASRMMGMPMPPLQAHAMAVAAQQQRQQQQQQQLQQQQQQPPGVVPSIMEQPPLAGHSIASMAHGPIGMMAGGGVGPVVGSDASAVIGSGIGAIPSSSQSSMGNMSTVVSAMSGMDEHMVGGGGGGVMERK